MTLGRHWPGSSLPKLSPPWDPILDQPITILPWDLSALLNQPRGSQLSGLRSGTPRVCRLVSLRRCSPLCSLSQLPLVLLGFFFFFFFYGNQ